jgi:hypothetical protein
MSGKTWLKEFFPVAACDAAEGTNLEAVRHSLQKWKGLRPDVMKKHHVRIRQDHIHDRKGDLVMIMGDASCALCHKHDMWFGCSSCPLARVRSGKRCDRERQSEEVSPWGAWVTHRNPEPMIAALEKAEARLLADSARKRKAG